MKSTSLRAWLEEWSRLGRGGFAAKYSTPFLLLQEPREDKADPERDTDLGFVTMKIQKVDPVKVDPLDLPVHQVSKREDSNVFGMMITVGRAENNDIVIDSASVSKFHAFFLERDGRWHVQDADSSNGTFLGPVRLVPKIPTPLGEDCDLRLADVPCRFLGPERMFAYLTEEALLLKGRGGAQ